MIHKDLRIEIRPIPDKGSIREFSEQLEYFSQAHILSPLVDPNTLKYVTGLDAEDIKFLQAEKFPYELDDTYIRGKAHPFWESSLVKVELVNSPMFLYPGKNLLDFVKYKFLLKSSYIYSSETEMRTGSKPEATHYIYDESEENKVKAQKIVERTNLLSKIASLSPADKRKVILIILNENTDNKNDDYLTVRLEDIINDRDLSQELKLLLDKSVEEWDMEAMIKDCIYKNIFTRNRQGIFFYDAHLGKTEKDVKSLLMDPKNQDLFLRIKEKMIE